MFLDVKISLENIYLIFEISFEYIYLIFEIGFEDKLFALYGWVADSPVFGL